MTDLSTLIRKASRQAQLESHAAACTLVRETLTKVWGHDPETVKRKLLTGLGYRFSRRLNHWHRDGQDEIHSDHTLGAVVSILIGRVEAAKL